MKDAVFQVYKVTNLLNSKVYIGVHKVTDEGDEYFGSGKLIQLSIKKHGIENFKKEILFEYQTADEAYAKEAELVNSEFVKSDMTYNLTVGGTGGWERYGSGNSGKVVVRDSSGNRFLVEKTDPHYLSGELVPWNRSKPQSKSSNEKRSQALKGRLFTDRIPCPHCGRIIDPRPQSMTIHIRSRACITNQSLLPEKL